MTQSKTFLVFDFDGTLCDSIEHFLPAINSLSSKYNFKPLRDHAHLEELKNKGSQEIFKELDFDLVKLPFLVRDLRSLMSANIEQVRLYANIEEELLRLREHVADMAILSSNNKENIEFVLGKYKVQNLFSEISAKSLFFGKSAKMKKIRATLLKKHGAAKIEGCRFLYVGDETKDIEAAREAGFEAIAVSWGIQAEGILRQYNPNLLVTKTEELSHRILAYLTNQD